MRTRFRLATRLVVSAVVFVVMGQRLATVQAQTAADDVLDRMDTIQRSIRNESSRLEMRLFKDDKQIRRRELTMRAETDTAGLTSALIEFTHPPDIRGTRLLTVQTNNGNDQRVYLPALRRVQRIAGKAREDRFAGSDLSYEDLRVRDRNDYSSRIIDSSSTKWVIESVPKDRDSPYSRIVADVDKDTYAVVQAKYFDAKDRLRKILTSDDFVDVGSGVWKASKITMEDVREDRRTELLFLERDFQTVIPPEVFTERFLRRGVQ